MSTDALTAALAAWLGCAPTDPRLPAMAAMLRTVSRDVWAALEHGHGTVHIPVKQGRIVRVERETTDYSPLDAT